VCVCVCIYIYICIYIHIVISGFCQGVNETSLFWNFTQCRLVFVINVLGQTISPVFKCEAVHLYCLSGLLDLEDGTERLSRNVDNKLQINVS